MNGNECWVGPFDPGVQAAASKLTLCNFYRPNDEYPEFLSAVAEIERVPLETVLPWPGSSDPLSRAVVTFCSPTRGIVTANPGFELPWWTADWVGAKISKVPLTSDYRHDVKAMLAADPNAGLTGTNTPLEDIEWLLSNKPAGSIVLVDEAYIHFSNAKPASYLVAQGKDVLVLRTFSKLFGMASMRMGISMAPKALHDKMMRYDGRQQSGTLPLPSLACATASLKQPALIAQRKAEMIAARNATFDHLQNKRLSYIPSDANMFMVDWKRPAKDVVALFEQNDVAIGRSWDIWPTISRITVGSAANMEKFCSVVDKII
ncbi:aminotransferase class I/II-fold pyridoxal phosphate-dependent enzyme [Sphingobium yanoikuyae]|uniref:aminotransferase class I/II-fold pyridoxal phosphate-dependent enzyme n=1 Tax=Sphingobium yanoikuyae TaxID=13690 RepID=UPI001F2E20AB|nr:aminotransferase class I/II-fold pyridoxal phosphate-dependent enzyme [Sphingobium yanoikuyae]